MSRTKKIFETLWGFSENPFPHHAIASAGGKARPFYENLHPGIGNTMARAFLGSRGTPPNVCFLWSLGEGDEARGYGKTEHLLWFTNLVNTDLGKRASKLAGRSSQTEIMVAAYAAFNSAEGLSLSNFLFDLVRGLVCDHGSLLAERRKSKLEDGVLASELYSSSAKLLYKNGEPWSEELLDFLCYRPETEWAEFVNDRERFSSWHTVRWGPRLLRTCVAFLLQLGVDRLIALVDQLEDFANSYTPRYKLRRDLPRLATLCASEKLLRDRLTFVLTMHPRAAQSAHEYWPEGDLGPIREAGDRSQVVVLGAMKRPRFSDMVKLYLNSARIGGARDSLHPFNEQTLDYIFDLEKGRPGFCLRSLYNLFEEAAIKRQSKIGVAFAEAFFGEDRD